MQLNASFLGTSVHSSRYCDLGGRKIQNPCGRARVVMRQEGIHPEMFEAKVFCKGEHVRTVNGTIPEYQVEIWSGNHPFYLGNTGTVIEDDGRADKFKKKFEGLDMLSDLGDLASQPPSEPE